MPTGLFYSVAFGSPGENNEQSGFVVNDGKPEGRSDNSMTLQC